METLTQELTRRWSAMFAALAAGDDVPPSRRLRAEGVMEAALLLGAATAGEAGPGDGRVLSAGFRAQPRARLWRRLA